MTTKIIHSKEIVQKSLLQYNDLFKMALEKGVINEETLKSLIMGIHSLLRVALATKAIDNGCLGTDDMPCDKCTMCEYLTQLTLLSDYLDMREAIKLLNEEVNTNEHMH